MQSGVDRDRAVTPSYLHYFSSPCNLEWTGTVRWLHLFFCILFRDYTIWSGREPYYDHMQSLFQSGTVQSRVERNRMMTPCNHSISAPCSLERTGPLSWPFLYVPSVAEWSAIWCRPHLIVFAYLVDSVWSCKKPLVALTQLISILFRHHSVWGGKEPYVILILFQHHANWSVDRNGMISSCNSYSFPAPRNLEWTGTVWWPHVILIPFRHHIIESGQEPHDDPM